MHIATQLWSLHIFEWQRYGFFHQITVHRFVTTGSERLPAMLILQIPQLGQTQNQHLGAWTETQHLIWIFSICGWLWVSKTYCIALYSNIPCNIQKNWGDNMIKMDQEQKLRAAATHELKHETLHNAETTQRVPWCPLWRLQTWVLGTKISESAFMMLMILA